MLTHSIKYILAIFLIKSVTRAAAITTLPKCCPEDSHTFKNGKCELGSDPETNVFYFGVFSTFLFDARIPRCANSSLPKHSRSVFLSEDINKIFTDEGYYKQGHTYYSRDNYCINTISFYNTKVSVSVLICEPECTDSSPCFHKCCPPNQVLTASETGEFECVALTSTTQWTPVVYNVNGSAAHDTVKNPNFIISGKVMEGNFFVFPKKTLFEYQQTKTRILKNGKVIRIIDKSRGGKSEGEDACIGARASVREKEVYLNDFCMDGIILAPGNNSNNSDISDSTKKAYTQSALDENDTVILMRVVEGNSEQAAIQKRTSNIYKTAFFISAIFLFLTITVYICLWEKHRNVQWLTQTSYFISLFLMYVSLAVAFIYSDSVYRQLHNAVISNGCLVVGVLAHFFFLSTFCWMTMLNVGLWSRFGNKNKIFRPKSKKLKAYFWNASFAFGIPSVIVGVGIILNSMNWCEGSGVIIPNYGRENCYVKSNALFPYLIGPVGVLMTVNVIIFVVILISVLQFKKTDVDVNTSKNRNSSTGSGYSEGQKSLFLFGKLFLLMGVSWTLEILSWSIRESGWIWRVVDLFNILQAVVIFFIFVWKQDVVHELREKYPRFNKFLKFLHIQLGSSECRSPETSTTVSQQRGNPQSSNSSSAKPFLHSNTNSKRRTSDCTHL